MPPLNIQATVEVEVADEKWRLTANLIFENVNKLSKTPGVPPPPPIWHLLLGGLEAILSEKLLEKKEVDFLKITATDKPI